jgi:hypothetical protein
MESRKEKEAIASATRTATAWMTYVSRNSLSALSRQTGSRVKDIAPDRAAIAFPSKLGMT